MMIKRLFFTGSVLAKLSNTIVVRLRPTLAVLRYFIIKLTIIIFILMYINCKNLIIINKKNFFNKIVQGRL